MASAPHVPFAVDVGANLDSFVRAVERFGEQLGRVGLVPLAIALALSLALQLCRGNAWSNALRAAYPTSGFRRSHVIAAFLIGAGMNGVLPARGGDAMKIVLAKRSVPGSSYPAIISSFAVLSPFDSLMGLAVLVYAITQGLLPRLPRIPRLPAFDVTFWAEHPVMLVVVGGSLLVGLGLLLTMAYRRAGAVWRRLKQGVAILRTPRVYLRRVFAWQLASWIFRFASFWLFLDAFHIGGSFEAVLLVMSVQSIAGALPFTPGGAGAQQALLVATLNGPTRRAVLAYSVGQQIAVTVFSVLVAVLSLIFVFRTSDWRGLLREGRMQSGAPGTAPGPKAE